MVNISNELSRSCPFTESVLEDEVLNSFKESGDNVNQGIEKLLKSLSEKPEGQGYKLIVTATSIKPESNGPIKTYTGAYWNEDQDGTWVTHAESLDLLVSLTWIRM